MPAPASSLTIPQIRAFLAVRSGLTVDTAAAEAGVPRAELVDALARIRSANAAMTRGKTRR